MRRWMALMMMTMLSACATLTVSETERTLCRELRRELPTWSNQDTPETLASGARFIAVFEAVCGLNTPAS